VGIKTEINGKVEEKIKNLEKEEKKIEEIFLEKK
jgi:hypothetical protein